MCKGIVGKKVGMVGMYTHDRQYVPVTVVQVGPCIVTQVKTKSKDGYNALQLGFGDKKRTRVTKPMQGHFKKCGDVAFSLLREVPVDIPENYTIGQEISANTVFEIGQRVIVTGITKGRGFAGVIKRHKFHGGRKTHGSHCVRIPGSVGSSAWPSRVTKGKRFPGHYGNKQMTIQNLLVMDIRPDENLMMLRGSIPGASGGFVEIKRKK